MSRGARRIGARDEATTFVTDTDLVVGGTLDRARRDLDLFLLQHRLEPKLVEIGRETLRDGAR